MNGRNPFDRNPDDDTSNIHPWRPYDPFPDKPYPQTAPTVDMYEVDILNDDGNQLECIVTFDPSNGSEQQAIQIVQQRLALGSGRVEGCDFLGQYQLGSENYNAQIQRVDHVIHNHTGKNPNVPDWDDPPIFWY